jgi:hypothetical protein
MRRFSTFIILALMITTITLAGISKTVYAHEEEEGKAGWLLSEYVAGKLNLTPDPSLTQWSNARLIEVEALDETSLHVMSIHNGTYVLILVERDLNNSIEKTGIVVVFAHDNMNFSEETWALVSGEVFSTGDSTVNIASTVKDDELIVTFGHKLTSDLNPETTLKVGEPYEDFIKVTSWNDGSGLDSINLENVPAQNFELLPAIDYYPKAPLVYSAVLISAVFLFIFLESRRYE